MNSAVTSDRTTASRAVVRDTSRSIAVPTATDSGRNDKLTDFTWLRALYELGQAAANGEEPLQVQQAILDHIVSGFGAASGSIALCVEGADADLLEIVAGTDLPPGVVGSQLPRGVGVFGHIIATGEPILINGDVAETGLPLQRNGRERRTHSAMCWPLRVRDRIIGAVAVNRAAGSSRYTVDDLDRGQALTSLLALVIANHRMHAERETRIKELSTLNASMQRMNSLLADAQEQLIQSEKLAAIGQLAAGMTHEINNPIGFVLSNLSTLDSYLTSVFGLLEIYIDAERALPEAPANLDSARALRQRVDFNSLRQDAAALLAESREGLLRVSKITQDVKGFSRGSGSGPEAWERVNLRDELKRALNIAHNEIKYKARVETNYGDMPEIDCIPARLQQVFLNLIVNASHAIEKNGTIRVSTGAGSEEVWVCVEDDGCGISRQDLKHIFEPFFTTKPVGKGTGLGLSVSDSIIRGHRGRIVVDTEVGRGSRFTVFLPCRQPPSEPEVGDAT